MIRSSNLELNPLEPAGVLLPNPGTLVFLKLVIAGVFRPERGWKLKTKYDNMEQHYLYLVKK
jgi:hypothetical protein